MSRPSPLNQGTDVEILDRLSAGVGSKLIGDEGQGPEVIEVTAVGLQHILARRVRNSKNQTVFDAETIWTLAHRDWKVFRG